VVRKYGDYFQAQVDIKQYIHPDKDYGVSEQTLLSWPPEERIGWIAQTHWQYEQDMNEKKRKIKLVSNKYLDQVIREIKDMFD